MKNLEEKINQKIQFDSMWREMNQIVEKAEKKTISIARCYPMKNRVPDVLPFDNSRFDIFIFQKKLLLFIRPELPVGYVSVGQVGSGKG